MARQDKIFELNGLVSELNQVAEVKKGRIGEYILEPNGKGYVLKMRISAKAYKTLTNYKQNSVREMTRFVRELLNNFNKILTK